MTMNSSLLECHLVHHRLEPREHRFRNRIFLLAADLGELESLHRRLLLFSLNRPNLFSLREEDFLRMPGKNPESGGLLERTRSWLVRRGINPGNDLRVVLVAIPRMFGHQFNPVAFHFCYRGSVPLCAIAEVTNTFRESKLYFLPPRAERGGVVFRGRMPKHFYVSPFSDAGLDFEFRLSLKPNRIDVRIDEHEGSRTVLRSGLAGMVRPLDDRMLAWYAVKYPLLGLQVLAGIHFQALRLYLKRIPWWRKDEQAELQRNFSPRPSVPTADRQTIQART